MSFNPVPAEVLEPCPSLNLPAETLRPLVQSILEYTGFVPGWPLGRVALNEVEAAECIGVQPHVLRDARLRLKLVHTRIGRTITYTAAQLQDAVDQMTSDPGNTHNAN